MTEVIYTEDVVTKLSLSELIIFVCIVDTLETNSLPQQPADSKTAEECMKRVRECCLCAVGEWNDGKIYGGTNDFFFFVREAILAAYRAGEAGNGFLILLKETAQQRICVYMTAGYCADLMNDVTRHFIGANRAPLN